MNYFDADKVVTDFFLKHEFALTDIDMFMVKLNKLNKVNSELILKSKQIYSNFIITDLDYLLANDYCIGSLCDIFKYMNVVDYNLIEYISEKKKYEPCSKTINYLLFYGKKQAIISKLSTNIPMLIVSNALAVNFENNMFSKFALKYPYYKVFFGKDIQTAEDMLRGIKIEEVYPDEYHYYDYANNNDFFNLKEFSFGSKVEKTITIQKINVNTKEHIYGFLEKDLNNLCFISTSEKYIDTNIKRHKGYIYFLSYESCNNFLIQLSLKHYVDFVMTDEIFWAKNQIKSSENVEVLV